MKIAYIAVCLIAALGFIQCAAPNVTKDLVGWWKFDETSGSVAKDASGKSVDCKIAGATAWEKGVVGGCLTLNGTDTNGFIEGNFMLPTYTITVWFKADPNAERRMDIVSAFAPGVMHGILLEVSVDGTLRFLHRFPLGQSGGKDVYTGKSYNDGKWHHAALVKTATTIAIYVDGVPKASSEETSTEQGDPFNVSIGCLDNERALDRLLAGSVDDLRIYNRALAADEIKTIFEYK
jgi:hypothetical protein